MSSTNITMMHGLWLPPGSPHRWPDPGRTLPPTARLPKVHCDESRTQGLDRLELIRFLQVAQNNTVHHGALAYQVLLKPFVL